MGSALALAVLTAGFVAAAYGEERARSAPGIAAIAANAAWVSTGTLGTRRAFHTATLLADGKVLLAGGVSAAPGDPTLTITAAAELYDPASGTSALTQSMSRPRVAHTATLLPSGKVLIVGGEVGFENRVPGPGTAEIYDPVAETWIPTGNLMTKHDGHTATLLLDGKVLVAGGAGSNILRSAELFDPATGSWTLTGNLAGARWMHTATLLRDGRVLVAMGSNDENYGSGLYGAELYDPVSGTWSAVGDLGEGMGGHTATLLPDGKVLVAGGQARISSGGSASLAKSNVFDPATGSWTSTGNLGTPRDTHSATLLPGGQVLIAGGTNVTSRSSGDYRSDMLASAEIYDSSTGVWNRTADLSAARSGHSATLLQDGKVLIAGGSIGGPLVLASAELYGDFVPGTIVPAFTGSWYDPAQSGHGLFVEVLPNNLFLAAWLTFNPAGTEQVWIVGVGDYSGNTAKINSVVQPTGGRWIPNFDPTRIVNNAWGTLTFTFDDCNHGRVDYSSVRGYGTGTMNLTRLTQPAGLACPRAAPLFRSRTAGGRPEGR